MAASAWAPFRQPIFRALWLAAVISYVGTWMHEVAAAWLMTALVSSPVWVALLQTASSLPFFLLALPAGALADIVDRRLLLLFTQSWMLVAATGLGVLTLTGFTTPGLLLALTFALGLGNALNMPAWQAIIPDLVTHEDLPAAAALNGAGVNLARAVGPALGGLIIIIASSAALGSGSVFLCNAASFLAVIAVLYALRRPTHESVVPAERVLGAVRAGIRYVRHSPACQAVLMRTGLFVFGASAVWALLPVVARHDLDLGSAGYGALFGCLGVGAVLGAAVLPAARQRLSAGGVVIWGTVLFALAEVGLACLREPVLAGVALVAGGIAWLGVMATFGVAAQTAVPDWVRARALAVYVLAFQGGMAAGGALWGTVATVAGTQVALLTAAGVLAAGLMAALRYRLPAGEPEHLQPSQHWAAPQVVGPLDPMRGPVLVTVEYRIDPASAQEFARAMEALGPVRRRDGAVLWGFFYDVADPGCYIETFVVETWAEHLRQHERVTFADQAIESRMRAYLVSQPVVYHWIAGAGPAQASG
jgi:MFS family permease